MLDVGQVSLHDIYMIHGSEPNRSHKPRRGMTLRYMPTTSRYCRDLADGRRGGPLAMSERTLYLMRGVDRSGGKTTSAFAGKARVLFADAEAGENLAEQVVDTGGTDNFAEILLRVTQFLGGDIAEALRN